MNNQKRAFHFLLTPIGSSGDVHPFLGIGKELLARGHDVTLLTGETFRETAESLGMAFEPTWDRKSYESITNDSRLWKVTQGLQLVLSTTAAGLEILYDLIERHYQPSRTILVGHTLSFATRMFEEKHDAPAATVHLAPSAFRSDYAQSAVPPGIDISGLPRWLKRAMWRGLDHLIIDPSIAPVMNAFRKRLGLKPVSRLFKEYLHSPRKVIGLFPDWFAPRQIDWPSQLDLTSFPLYDEGDLHVLADNLQAFLASGETPIVCTAGTGNRQAKKFFEKMIAAITRANRRALLLTPFAEQTPSTLPSNVMHIPYAPFSTLLPHCAAIIHHGGIGTTAQGLAAGIPQLIHPLSFDQPDNAMHAKRLGVAKIIFPWHSAQQVGNSLNEMIGSAETIATCRQFAERLRQTSGIKMACDILERTCY